MADDLHLRIVTDADSKGLQQAEKDLAATGKEAGKLDDIFVSAGKSSDKLEASLHEQTDEIKKLQVEYVRTKKSVSDLTVEWLDADRENDQIVRRELRRERSRLAELQRAAKNFESSFGIKFNGDLSSFALIGSEAGAAVGAGVTRGIGSAFQGMGRMPALAAGIAGLVTVVGPPLTAMLGGVVAGALGTGAMAVGILTAIKDPAVKTAAKQFGEDVMGEFFSGGKTFAEPIMAGLDILRQGVRNLGIADLLAPLAETVPVIAHGIADFVNNLKDAGLGETLKRMPEFAHIAAEGLAAMGQALGQFLDDVTSSPGAMDGLRAFFGALNGTLRLLGANIHFVEDRFHDMSVTMQAIAHLSNLVSPDWSGIQIFEKAMNKITGLAPVVSGQMVYLSTSAHAVNERLKDQADAMARLAEEAEATKRALDDFLGIQLSAAQANLAVEQGYMRLNEAFKENGRTLDVHTEKGLANRQAILDQIGTLERQRQASIRATGDMRGANEEYDRGLDRLKRMATAAGITGEALDGMIGDYYIRIHINAIANAAAALYGQVADVWNKFFPKRAHGGPVKADQPYVVGENEPELFVPSQNGVIMPKVPRANSSGSAASPSGVVWASPFVYNGSSRYGAALIEDIRTEVAARGGTLAVLGLRAA